MYPVFDPSIKNTSVRSTIPYIGDVYRSAICIPYIYTIYVLRHIKLMFFILIKVGKLDYQDSVEMNTPDRNIRLRLPRLMYTRRWLPTMGKLAIRWQRYFAGLDLTATVENRL